MTEPDLARIKAGLSRIDGRAAENQIIRDLAAVTVYAEHQQVEVQRLQADLERALAVVEAARQVSSGWGHDTPGYRCHKSDPETCVWFNLHTALAAYDDAQEDIA